MFDSCGYYGVAGNDLEKVGVLRATGASALSRPREQNLF